MKTLNHWFVCLDLSKMDDILIRYIHFLAKQLNPTTISFLHIIESDSITKEMTQLFPELETDRDFEELIREDLSDKIEAHFHDSDLEHRLIIKQGRPTDTIVSIIQSMNPDLLVLGKKTGYQGEGVLASKIVKYVPSSVLFVPETSRHAVDRILVPTDFSAQSAIALQVAQTFAKDPVGEVFAQHIFRYPAHFFPYIPSDKEDDKVKEHLAKKERTYINEYQIDDGIHFIRSFLKNGKLADEVYSETVRNQIDLIVLATKGDKKLSSLLREDFTDKLMNYSFGIPLLLLKNKKKHVKYLNAFFD